MTDYRNANILLRPPIDKPEPFAPSVPAVTAEDGMLGQIVEATIVAWHTTGESGFAVIHPSYSRRRISLYVKKKNAVTFGEMKKGARIRCRVVPAKTGYRNLQGEEIKIFLQDILNARFQDIPKKIKKKKC